MSESNTIKIFNLLREIEMEMSKNPNQDETIILLHLDEIDDLLENLELLNIKNSYIETISNSINDILQKP